MDIQIETIARVEERIKAKARAAFERGDPPESCEMHSWTNGYKTWHDEYARLAAEASLPAKGVDMASKHFGVGDRAIGQGFTKDRSRNGMSCEIIGALEFREWRYPNGSQGKSVCYIVRWADCKETIQEPADLRAEPKAFSNGPAWGFVGLNPCREFA